LVLCIPAFLAEPVDCLSNVRHQFPLGYLPSAIVLLTPWSCHDLLVVPM
jgi:hypothetical protein